MNVAAYQVLQQTNLVSTYGNDNKSVEDSGTFMAVLRSWTSIDFEKVVFSDELGFFLPRTKNVVANNEKRQETNNLWAIYGRIQYDSGGIIIWEIVSSLS